MEFICNLKNLTTAINNVCLAINKKINPIPVLEGILLECDENENLKITGFDLNLAIIKQIKINLKTQGSIVLKAQLFSEILRKMNGEEISIKCDEKLKTIISNNETKFNISGIDSSQFPKVFNVVEGNNFTIKSYVLKEMIFQTLFAVSQIPGQNPILCGVLFKLENDYLNLIGLDGYRVAISRRKIENLKFNRSFVVSNKALNEIYKLLSDDDENSETEIEFNDKYAMFKINGYKILTRLLEGEFLNYDSAIPKISNTVLIAKTQNLINRIERVSVMVTNRISVILKIENSRVELNCESSLGTVTDSFEAEIEGTNLEKIAFNFKYMLDALKHTQCEKIKISFKDSLSPIRIEPEDGEGFLFLVLPVRI